MIIEPKIRGFICTTAHPAGCARHVQEQIDFVVSRPPLRRGPKTALVIGASNGFGLSTRIALAFGGLRTATIGVFFEKPSDGKKTATAGWYNSAAFERKARARGVYAKSFNGDAFSDEIKARVAETVKEDWGSVDMLVYSLASPRRQDPKTGVLYKSVLKPLRGAYTNTSIDMSTDRLETVTLPEATAEEVEHTVKVMGGEDWELWVDALYKAGLLSKGFTTVAYSYIGPKVTQPVYRNGTIGKAKDHLEATADRLDGRLKAIGGSALISVNKAVVTQSSSAIPFIPLYFVILKKIMLEKGIEEDCIQQIWRMFSERLLAEGKAVVDENRFIRVDDWELRDDVQARVDEVWERLDQDNLEDVADLKSYHKEFLRLFGFGLDGVEYRADIDPDVPVPSIESENRPEISVS
jgi:enoyl-[acyl-carrier protein] reductase/trans-2-enoyl-CoA reductase (NAD+)